MANSRTGNWGVLLIIVVLVIVAATYISLSFENPLVANLVAFGIALLAIFIFEWVKRPYLDVDLQQEWYVDIPAIPNMRQRARMTHLKAVNRPIYRNWIQRSTATNCRSKVTVKDAGGKTLHNEVETKWAAREEPRRIVGLSIAEGPVLHDILDDYLVGQCDRLDIYANYEGEPFSVAVKVVDDPDCYLFRGESYRSTNQWRLPKYRIPPGDFTIEVFVKGDNGRSRTKTYRLLNNGTTPEDLTLESL